MERNMIPNLRSKWKLVVFQGVLTAILACPVTCALGVDVLILSESVSGGESSPEAQAAIALGYSVEVVDASGWLAKSQAQFASYRALILGDPVSEDIGRIQAAEQSRTIWAPIIDGNIIVVGADPVNHYGTVGARKLTTNAVAFALNQPNKTGLYICLSKYYVHAFGSPVPVLDRFGSFTVTGISDTDCYQASGIIVAAHPVLAGAPNGLTDADLYGWDCSVHQYFNTKPSTFEVFAEARFWSCALGTSTTLGPYIVTRGEALTPIAAVSGALDTTFNSGTGANATVHAIALQSDNILIGGEFTQVNGLPISSLVRLSSNGSVDTGFPTVAGPGEIDGPVYSIVIQPMVSDNKILVAGYFNAEGAQSSMIRYNTEGTYPDGTYDNSFFFEPLNYGPAVGYIPPAAVRSHIMFGVGPLKDIIAVGDFTYLDATSSVGRIGRFFGEDGRFDWNFSRDGADATVRSVHSHSQDNSFIIGGDFQTVGGQPRPHVARLHGNGDVDLSFSVGGNGFGPNNSVYAIKELTDGKLLIAGTFTDVGGYPRGYIARLHANGQLDIEGGGFAPCSWPNGPVYAIALDSAGRVLIGGAFTAVGSTPRNRIARLNPKGDLDVTFNPGTGANGEVRVITLHANGRILIGGNFTSYNNVPRNRIARLLP
jgi:uncharacterized delta-60 repeat protein